MSVQKIDSKKELTELIANKNALVMIHHSGSLASRTVLKTVTALADSGVNVGVADILEYKEISKELGVTAVPTVIGFAEGKESDRTIGIQSESFYRGLLVPKSEKQKKVILYKTPTCPWCNVAKKHLDSRGVSYTEIDVSTDFAAADRLMKKSGQTGVPQIEIGDEIVVGADVKKMDALLGF